MMTSTGRFVTMEDGAPSIEDIALGLFRQPRFGGQSRIPWSVLEHTVLCDFICDSLGGSYRERLVVFLHDAHESVMGDTPTTLKLPEVRAFQEKLDLRIYKDLGLAPPTYAEQSVVKLVDRYALMAEGVEVGPANWTVYRIGTPRPADCKMLQNILCYGRLQPAAFVQQFEYLKRRASYEAGNPLSENKLGVFRKG